MVARSAVRTLDKPLFFFSFLLFYRIETLCSTSWQVSRNNNNKDILLIAYVGKLFAWVFAVPMRTTCNIYIYIFQLIQLHCLYWPRGQYKQCRGVATCPTDLQIVSVGVCMDVRTYVCIYYSCYQHFARMPLSGETTPNSLYVHCTLI